MASSVRSNLNQCPLQLIERHQFVWLQQFTSKGNLQRTYSSPSSLPLGVLYQLLGTYKNQFRQRFNQMKQFYKVPDTEQRRLALGSLPGLSYKLKKSIEAIKDMFEPMDKPVQGEWLYEHEEEGQTYDAYKGQMHNEVDQKRNVIYIRPLEPINKQFLGELQAYCSAFFHPMKVKIASQLESLKGITTRINPYTQKPQLNARDVLQVLRNKLPADAFCMIGVSVTDLYPREQWNFVFGLASIRDRTGVFSFARYDERFFEMKKYETDYNLIKFRSMGVMGHQITHMFGVRHCVFYKCLMNGSNHLEESSKKPIHLCVVCLRKLQSNIKFDILERYQLLRQFFCKQKDERANKEIGFLQEAIKRIEGNLKT